MFKENDMKTTELRIGNIVNAYKVGVCRVDGIESDILISTANDEYIPINDVDDIPLKEQWLLDLEFEKCIGRYGVYYKHYALEGFRVWLPRDIYGWGYTVGRKDFKTGDTYWVKNEVRYVHQLQNLFFALTGKELVLKERTL